MKYIRRILKGLLLFFCGFVFTEMVDIVWIIITTEGFELWQSAAMAIVFVPQLVMMIYLVGKLLELYGHKRMNDG